MVGPGRLFHFYSVQGDGSKIPGGPSKEISGEYFPGANAPSQVSKGGCRQCGTLSQMGNVARSGNVSHLGNNLLDFCCSLLPDWETVSQMGNKI